MQHALTSTRILDLTSKQILFELAIEDEELRGSQGAKLISELRGHAQHADYTHMVYRDPIRPGIIWFVVLEQSLPLRGNLEECRRITEKIFPGFLAAIEEKSDEEVATQMLPQTTGICSLELATALEYLTFMYPNMLRAWASLVFIYNEVFYLHEGAEAARAECWVACPGALEVAYLVAPVVNTK